MPDEFKLIGFFAGAGLGLLSAPGAYIDEWCSVQPQRAPYVTLCPREGLAWDLPHGQHNDPRPEQPSQHLINAAPPLDPSSPAPAPIKQATAAVDKTLVEDAAVAGTLRDRLAPLAYVASRGMH
jgi:hypothetical protein